MSIIDYGERIFRNPGFTRSLTPEEKLLRDAMSNDETTADDIQSPVPAAGDVRVDQRQRPDAVHLVDAAAPGVDVPQSAVKDGRVVLNVAARAVAQLELGMDRVRFMARFSGVSHAVDVPMAAILAIYAHENGQGMMFPAENQPPQPPSSTAAEVTPLKKGQHLRVVK